MRVTREMVIMKLYPLAPAIIYRPSAILHLRSSSRAPRRLEKVECDMRLPLMVRLVPGNDLQRLADTDAAFLERRRNSRQIGFRQLQNGPAEVFASLRQDVANRCQAGYVVVRRASAAEAGDEVGEGRCRS